jgi:2-iminobutanoate/2-iminopropanoate deaminase
VEEVAITMDPVLVGRHDLPFSAGIRCDGFLFVSGQASVDPATGEIIPGTFGEEMERSLENLRSVLRAAGARWEDVVKVNCYLRRDTDLDEYNRIYKGYFQEPYPARTTITNCLPPFLLFEIDCVVRLPETRDVRSRGPA